MEIRTIEAFLAVAEELHFGRAANRLQMAQSPLSQTIRRLERELGTPLFERSTRSVALTASGHALLPHARNVLQELDAARQATRASVGRVYGRLRVGFSGVPNHLSLPPLTRAARARYPDVQLDLVGRVMTQDALRKLEEGSLDIAFVGLPVVSTKVASRLIARERFGAALPADHRLAGLDVVKLADLASDDFVSPPAGVGSALHESMMRACQEAGFRPRVTQEVSDPYMSLMLVAAGIGVALMTESMGELAPPGTVFKPLADTSELMRHGIAWSLRPGSFARDAVLRLSEEVLPTPTPESETDGQD